MDPKWTPSEVSASPPTAAKACKSGPSLKSGRQDLNLRPPSPQSDDGVAQVANAGIGTLRTTN